VKLKATYDNQEDIPSQYVGLFQQKGDKWAIEIEGIQTEANVARLEHAIKNEREENAKLREEVKAYGRTPEEVQTILEEMEAFKATIASGGGKPNEERVQKLVDAQVRTKVGPLERQIQKLTKDLLDSTGQVGKLNEQIVTGKIELAIRAAAEKAKVLPSAIPDLVMRGKPAFDVINVDGREVVVTKEGTGYTAGLAPNEWVNELAPTASHYWPANQGAGANGSGANFGITEKNPWTKDHWNLTEKGKIIRKYGEEKAAQIAKQAGSELYATEPPPR
jgi:hypothetical protein